MLRRFGVREMVFDNMVGRSRARWGWLAVRAGHGFAQVCVGRTYVAGCRRK
jgi:hypothetical protein